MTKIYGCRDEKDMQTIQEHINKSPNLLARTFRPKKYIDPFVIMKIFWST